MENKDWGIILTLNNEKNITKAAQILYMSQPALTSKIKNIEQELGVQLILRSSRGIQFTPEGKYVVNKAEKMVVQLEQMKNELRSFSNSFAGTIEICASHYFTMYRLPKILQMFKQKYPEADFKVTTNWSKDLFSLVNNQKANIGFVNVDYGGCENRQLLYEDSMCVASAKPFEFKDLVHLPGIEYQRDYLVKMQMEKWWRENFNRPPLISMYVDKITTCREMVSYGLGYGILPEEIISNIPNVQKHYLVDKNGEKITRKTWMIYNEEEFNTPIIKIFIDFVKKMNFNKNEYLIV
ncbi:MAG: yofA 2 [Firmicutes bacterium]|nr:yofA 2 [Bacillota bacterium]